MLDLNGNGLEVTDKAHGVVFNVDDGGYLKQTAWLKPTDGFLVLDRNLNGQIDSGRELFNGTVANEISQCYEFSSWSRPFLLVYGTKTLLKMASNEAFWRVKA